MSGEFIEKLLNHVDRGNVSCQDHPTEPLTIFNYTNKCQYDRAWDEVTMQCRGLIYDDNFNIISRCLPKFFNLSELGPDQPLPDLPYEIFKKYDGSCLISYWLGDRIYWATRGSFTSDQANWANELWERKYKFEEVFLSPYMTYVAELIVPQNRIVVDYGDQEKIVFTAIIDTETGEERNLDWLCRPGFDVAEKYPYPTYATPHGLKELNIPNEEGYVIRYANGFRVKVKFEEYIRLHKIITNVTSYDIWECLRDGKPLDEILDRVPDEFMDWVRQTEADISGKVLRIATEAQKRYYHITINAAKFWGTDLTRRKLADEFKQDKYESLLFAQLDGKDIMPMIYKMVKPKYERPFSNEYKRIQI